MTHAERGTPGSSHHHIVPFETLIRVFVTLLALTFLTVLAAQFDFGFMNTVVAVGIATVKAALVASIFMGLKYDSHLNRVVFAAGFFFLMVLYFFSKLDVLTRVFQTSTL